MQSGSTPQTQDYFAGLELPSTNDMEIQLQQLVQQGVMSPEEAQTVMLESSDMNNVSTDPRLKENQMDALLGLQEISDSGGMTSMDKANLNKIATDESTRSRGAREAILQNAQARGMGGSGLEMMSQMQNEQDSATRQSQRDMDVAGMAQDRALQALIQGGNMSGQMQGQEFNQKAQVAGANDAISRFNTQNKQQQINQNVGARNDAQAANLNAKQGIANANVAQNNQQQQYNKNLLQQNYDNQLKKRSGQSGVAQANAQAQGQNSQNQANANNQMIGALIGAGASAFGAKGKKDGGLIEGEPTPGDSVYEFTQPGEFVVRKEDVPDMLKKMHTDDDGEFDAAGFLDQITGHKYGYSKKGKK